MPISDIELDIGISSGGDDEAALDRAMKEEVRRLIDKFVRDWPDAPRVHETFVLAQEIGE